LIKLVKTGKLLTFLYKAREEHYFHKMPESESPSQKQTALGNHDCSLCYENINLYVFQKSRLVSILSEFECGLRNPVISQVSHESLTLLIQAVETPKINTKKYTN
jgi:hypothetical protein